MDGAIQIFAAFGPFVLTVMGVIVSIKPPASPKAHYAWLGLFLIIGLPTSFATYAEMRSSDKTSNDTNTTVHDLRTENKGLNSSLQSISKSLGLNAGSPLGDILLKIEALSPHVLSVKGGSIYQVPAISALIDVQRNKAAKTILILPAAPYVGERFDIKFSGSPADSNTAVQLWVRGNGHSVDGYPEYGMPFANQAITVTFDGKRWVIT